MNCKQGDLAVVVRSLAGHEGKIVTCVRLTYGDGAFGYGPRWVTEPGLLGSLGTKNFPISDGCLRPVRDSDGEDEMLRLVGLPAGTPQAA